MTAVFRSHQGATPGSAAFTAHQSPVTASTFSSHTKAVAAAKRAHSVKLKKITIKKMSMSQFKYAAKKQIIANLEAKQGL